MTSGGCDRASASNAMRAALVGFLTQDLGTQSLERAKTYMEDAPRMTAHLAMSTPDNQID
jgi:hypothetical protein